MKNICIIGQGFVGSVMSVACARVKKNNKKIFKVYGLDSKNEHGLKNVKRLNKGKLPFKSNDQFLNKEFKKIIQSGNFLATIDDKIITKCKILVISINIDVANKKKRKKDLQNFKNLIYLIGRRAQKKTLIILESTLPPGFSEKVVLPIIKKFRKNLLLSYSYERVMPGTNYLNSLISNYRVYSGINLEAKKKCKEFLSKIIDTKKYPLTCLENIRTVETAKILENTYRAVNIAFIDEWTKFSEIGNINLNSAIDAIRMRSTHSNIRYPGLGVGGYCLTKDPLFAQYSVNNIFKKDLKLKFSNMSVQINNLMPKFTIKKLSQDIKKIKKKKILLMGVAYKSDVGDTRQSPSSSLFDFLKKKQALVRCVDPFVDYWEEKKENIFNEINIEDEYDIVIFAVPHTKFKFLKLDKLFSKKTIFYDLNNCLSSKQINNLKKKKYRFKQLGNF